jgi:hypothetical protein
LAVVVCGIYGEKAPGAQAGKIDRFAIYSLIALGLEDGQLCDECCSIAVAVIAA